jgi:aspartyl-tRNA(Asn)/glutamyl-tRNA(Gln) amidotransferase subunit B
MAHPGTLPVINSEAVRQVVRVGLAVGGTVADFTEFDRKNYFYPDIPKGYQISQYKYPLISGGSIGGVAITRIHLEEDTASSTHRSSSSEVNFNRAGVPLMELVTEPVIHDEQTAISFARDLRLLLRFLGASHANLEKGEMRIEANISIAHPGEPFGTKVEVKNLNSFKAVEQAIRYEVKRQAEQLHTGKAVLQETRGWDENKQKTFSQRSKENAHDYRYFPEPDLPKLYLSELPELAPGVLRATLPILPWELRTEYQERGLQPHVIEALVANEELNTLYMAVYELLTDQQERTLAVNYITSDIVGLLALPPYAQVRIASVDPAELAELMRMVADRMLSSRGAKDILSAWLLQGGSVREIATTMQLLQISDSSELSSIINTVLAEHAPVVAEYRAGKMQALQFLVGQGMKLSHGSANPELLRTLLIEQIATDKA